MVTSVTHHLNTSTVGRALARETPNNHAKLTIYNPSKGLVTSVIHRLNTSTVGRALARETPNDYAKLAIYIHPRAWLHRSLIT
ncbi:hypothetical protein [Pseudoalteromonas porphyrae]|uniref:hypothetical protein n=1 Tax=Pseudoalteromonas porphyrae TaxID=187330 RepID=UPI00128FA79C|nr:hypothetical protein [Pseudoalteromonas porphyrae]